MPGQPAATPLRSMTAIAVLSMAMLALELTLTRLFALAQFYHFAFMVVSLALLGIGAAGSLLSAWPRLGRDPAWGAAGFAVAALGSLIVLNTVPFDSYAIAWDSRQLAWLSLTFGGACAPFVFGGLTVGAALARDAAAAHRVYGANLLGSAVGCLAALPLLAVLGGEGALAVCAAGGLAAAALMWSDRCAGEDGRVGADESVGGKGRVGEVGRAGADESIGANGRAGEDGRAGASGRPGEVGSTPRIRRRVALAWLGCAALLVLAVVRPGAVQVRISPYKALSQALRAEGADRVVSRWAAAGRVDVVESTAIHSLPGLSQNSTLAEPPVQHGVTMDGDDLAPITVLDPSDPAATTLAASVPIGAADALRPGGRRLVLNPAGGWPVLIALAGNASGVTVIEEHAARAELLLEDYAATTGDLYGDPRTVLRTGNPRTLVRQEHSPYDVIHVALGDSFHPITSGAFALNEDYRYTVEALSDLLARLGPRGVLVLTRWLQTPPTESLRVLSTIDAALRDRGVEQPSEHLGAFRSLRTMTFVVGAEPLDRDDGAALRTFVDERGYDLVWLPDLRAEEANRHLQLARPAYYEAFGALLDDPDAYVADHAYDIRPPTDDRPFFFHFFRWGQTPEILAGLGRSWQPFGGSGYLVLVGLLALAAALSAALIVGPLLVGSPRRELSSAPGEVRRWSALYFGSLGLAYLLVLIPLAQRFTLFLDQPVIALAVVFSSVLFFSGLGSLTVRRWRLGPALASLVVAAVLTPLALDALFSVALGFSQPLRLVLSAASLAPLGYLVGLPFAGGLAVLESRAAGLTPWAWAINGCTSVLSGVLAVMIALAAGFSAATWCGAAAYALALLALRGLRGPTASRPCGRLPSSSRPSASSSSEVA